MEPNILASEDSIDSIPGPTYERIIVTKSSLKSGATNSTSIAEDEDVEMEGEEYSEGNEDHIDPVQIQNGRGELERDQADVEGDDGSFLEDDCGERDDYKENEHQMEQVELNALEVAAVAAAAATELPSEQASNKSVVVDKKTPIAEEPAVDHARICPMPVQIVSGLIVKPNILPMKTKSNKIIMAPQINDQAAEGSTGAILCSSTGQPSNSGHKIVGGAESMISDADKLQSLNEGKLPDSLQQQQNARFLARSSTPLSREFLALQRSVNESKVLSEFVTDPVRKRQKNAPKDSTEQTIPQQQQQNNHHHHHHHHHHGEKHRKSGKFAPLKDDSGSSNSSILARRSRSKSVNRKSEDILDASGGKLNRWPSDEKMLKRTNMRSQNSEFVQKQMEFLSRVKHDEGEVSSEADDGERSFVNGGEEDDLNLVVEQNAMNECNVSAVGLVGSMNSLSDVSLERECVGNIGTSPKVDSVEARLLTYWAPPPKRGWDCFCWKCRECVDLFPCSKCVRCFHCTCIKVTSATKLDDTWVCPECLNVDNVLNGPKRNSRRAEISLDLLSQLLSFALKRMKMVKGYSKFLYTDRDLLHYSKYIANPVTFTTLQEKVEKRAFRCAEEFLNETKWILHNALILSSGSSSKEVFTAKAILKVCRQETNEIDTCAECYLNANTRTDWFVDVCSQPHLLLWAKLKGFPYWPAKAMGPGQGLSHVNVRFFGEHDRAFVPVKDCFLYSEQDPNTQTGKRSARELADCIKEVEVHIEKIKSKVGTFKYAKFKTPYEPMDELQQLEMMIPGVTEYMKRQQALVPKPSLQYKIVKTADNHLSIIKKASTTESGNDSDHSVSPHKKASSTAACTSGGSSGASDAKTTVVTPKYEVVSKASSDDSNSSKVTAVILKRKSSTEHKKEANDELELPMPKMIKFDEEGDESGQLANTSTTDHANAGAEQISADTTGKRKNIDDPCDGSTNTNCSSIDGVASMETAGGQRTKYAKYEPRVPMITIKTNVKELGVVVCPETKSSTRSSATNPNNSMSAIISTETKISNSVKEEVAIAASLTPITTHSSNNNAQTLMENLVKNKHGVTIKKISKEGLKKPEESTNSTNVAGTGPITDETQPSGQSVEKKSTDAAADPAIETPQDVAAHKNPVNDTNPIKEGDTSNSIIKNSERNLKGTAKSATNTHILKDLVPFVEIKKEITSDDEAETQPAPDMDIQNNKQKDVVATTTTSTVQTLQAIAETPLQESLPATSTPSVEPNLSLVKQEVMSDEEEAVGVPYSTASISSSQQEVSTSSTLGDVAVDNQSGVMTTNLLPDAVRVGETMIQRVNTKNLRNSQPSLVALKPVEKATQESSAVMDGLTPGSSAMHFNQPNKRPNTRGVPYGPLPASAIITQQSQPPKSVASSNTASRMILQQQQQQNLSQLQSQTQTQSSSQTQPQLSSQTSPQSTSQVQSESSQAPLQRARKSFPNRSTPDISTIRGNGSNLPLPPPALPPPITSSLTNNNDLKRTLLKNSMVSIPRQAWSPHDQQRNANIVISNTNTNSIPVPPLTAVSKTSTALTVLSNNSSSSVNSNMNANMAINTTPIATTFVTCNGTIGPNGPALLTPLTMSAPPPLAGLSQSSSNMIATPAVAAITTNMPLFDVNTNNSVSTGSGNITLSSTVELATQQAGTSSSTSGVASTSSGDLVTPSFTAMVTDAICRGPPKMVQRPNGPLKSDGTTMFPSQAGPVCQTLVENAHKLTDFFISVMEDTMLEMSLGEEPVLQAKITLLKMELERTKQAYEQEIAELKRTSDLMICEMRKSMENEKTRISNEIRKQCEQERLRSIDETKKKQWCSNCGREAQFYCCWNTSYCDYPCQQMHWSRHSATCAQTRPTIASASDSLAKTVSTMTTTVSAMGLQQQQQQQQQQLQQTGCGSKNASNMMAVTNPTSMNVSQHNYNKNTLSNKKEKQKVNHQQSVANSMGVSSTGNNSMASIAAGVSVPTGAPTELLKLPSNTYLRTVTQGGSVGNNNNGGGGNMRGSTYSVQRVNIPLPITALVQRGNSWELTSAAPNSNSGAANMAALTAPGSNLTQAMTQMAPPQQQQQQQQQHQQHRMMSGSGTTSNISMGRSNSRNRAAAAAAQAMQQTMATMHNATSGTATSMPCGMMRPTQM